MVGAGIVGLAVARELALRHDGLAVAVLEREPRIAAHQTSHSSGVMHSGIYYEPGSLKARLCVAGARELYEYCDERGIPAPRGGKLIVATGGSELGRLDELERRGRANGVAGLERLDAGGMREVEPHGRRDRRAARPAHRRRRLRPGRERRTRTTCAARGGRVITGCAVPRVDATGAGVTVGPRGRRDAGPRRDRLRRRLGRPARASRRGRSRARGSSRSEARTCGSSPPARASCAPTSTPCPTPSSPSSALT